jgi:folate-binding protein YgfZ
MTKATGRIDPLGGFASDAWAASEVPGVVVTGDDAIAFLQGQLSQDIASLEVGDAKRSLLLEPDGTLGYLVWVGRLEESAIVLLGAPTDAEAIEARLRRFKLRVKVELAIAPLDLIWLGPASTEAPPEDAAELTPTSVPGRRFIRRHLGGGVIPHPTEVLEDLAMRNGSIEPGDVAACRTPHELGARVVSDATSFTKGCYTGQELVARVDARGAAAPFRLVFFHADSSLVVGSSITAGGEEVGIIHRALHVAEGDATVGFARIARRGLSKDAPLLTADGTTLFVDLD